MDELDLSEVKASLAVLDKAASGFRRESKGCYRRWNLRDSGYKIFCAWAKEGLLARNSAKFSRRDSFQMLLFLQGLKNSKEIIK